MRKRERKVRELSAELVHLCGVGLEVHSDEELGSLALRGDVAALAVLLERCRPSLYASAVALMNNRADALDAVQDTFMVALLRLGDVRDVGAVRAWLHAVLRNICRARIRQRREVPTEEVVGSPGSVPGPEEALETHVMREWIWQSLDGLNPDERLTVMLRHFSRYSSYEAIARITAVPGRDGPQSPPPRPVTSGRCAHEDRRQFDEPCRPGIRPATAMG